VCYQCANVVWPDLAEASPELFPDEYATSPEETLYINRLEIGTPNFLELVGLASPLVEVFAYIGGFAGLIAAGKGIVSLVKDFYDIQDKRYSIHERKLKIQQLSRELDSDEAKKQLEQQVIDLQRPESYFVGRVQELYENGHISATAMEHKRQMNNDIDMMANYFLPVYCREPSLIVIEMSRK